MSVALKEEVDACVTDTEAVNANLVEARWKCGVYQGNFLVARSNVESHTSAQEQVKRARRPRLRRTCDRIMRRTIACPEADCVLMDFMPKECRYEAVPCRHIPLNEAGETVDSLYRTGTNEEIERAVRQWLLTTIKRLEQPTQSGIWLGGTKEPRKRSTAWLLNDEGNRENPSTTRFAD